MRNARDWAFGTMARLLNAIIEKGRQEQQQRELWKGSNVGLNCPWPRCAARRLQEEEEEENK